MVVNYNPWAIEDETQDSWDLYEASPKGVLDYLFSRPFLYTADTLEIHRIGLDSRAGWRSCLAEFGIIPVSDQGLTIDWNDSTATGTVLGVEGHNWVLVGIEEAQKVFRVYRGSQHAESGETAEVWLGEYWDIPQR